MNVLHVAALPYPSPQGTQAAIGAMLEALSDRGRCARLLTYAHGTQRDTPARFEHIRLPRSYGDTSLRSGPSLAKIREDAALVRALSHSHADLFVAHHVEAASACLLAKARPLVFIAHTALGPELPTYLHPWMRALSFMLERTGDALDRMLARRADAALAISPRIAECLSRASGVDVRWLPLPWSIPAPITQEERLSARHMLGLYGDDKVLLYAGNLDAYQGIDILMHAYVGAHEKHRTLRLLLATASDTTRFNLPRGTRIVPLACDEAQRRALHAAADLVVIPREIEGGLPIKLIDALARGVPVACVKSAAAGLSLHGCAAIAAPDELAATIDAVLRSPVLASEFADAGRAWVAREMNAARFLSVLDDAVTRAANLVDEADAFASNSPRRTRMGGVGTRVRSPLN